MESRFIPGLTSQWREMKSYRQWIYITTEAAVIEHLHSSRRAYVVPWGLRDELRSRLIAWMIETDDPCASGSETDTYRVSACGGIGDAGRAPLPRAFNVPKCSRTSASIAIGSMSPTTITAMRSGR